MLSKMEKYHKMIESPLRQNFPLRQTERRCCRTRESAHDRRLNRAGRSLRRQS
jgi:hypothetical protein